MDSQKYCYESVDFESHESWNSIFYDNNQNCAFKDRIGSNDSPNLHNLTVSLPSIPSSVTSLSEQFDLFSLVDKAHDEVQYDIQYGIEADYCKCDCEVCKWFQNPSESSNPSPTSSLTSEFLYEVSSRKRGRPENEKEYEKQNIWRNNWIYRQKKSIENEIHKAKQNEIFQTNEALNGKYFDLCLEYISLWEILCPHNRATLEKIKQNPNLAGSGDCGFCLCVKNGQAVHL